MRSFFMAICAPGIYVIALLEILILVLLLKEYKKNNKTMVLCMSLITLGLIVDALVIGSGAILGSALKAFTRIRFVAHGILIPLLFPICGYALNAKKNLMKAIWGLTIVVMIAGAMEGFATDLQVAEIAGVYRMLSGEGTPAWAEMITNVLSFGTVIPLIICGLIAMFKQKNGRLFFAGFFMFAFSALGPATGNADLLFFISMIGEILMVTFFYLYAKKKYRQ